MCNRHGGRLPSVEQAAARRLYALADGATATVEELLAPYQPKMIRLKAAKLVMLQLGLPVAAARKRPDVVDVEIEKLVGGLLKLDARPDRSAEV